MIRNFHIALLETRTERLSVFRNCVYLYLAFAPVNDDHNAPLRRNFISPIHAKAQFEALTNFVPLDADWLMSDLKQDMLIELSPADVRQIQYYKPRCLGDVIFNDWD